MSGLLVTRDVVWGCQIVTGPYHLGSDIPMRGTMDHASRLDPNADDVQVGVFASPKKTHTNASTGIIFGCPRGTAPAVYFTPTMIPSSVARVEFIMSNGDYTIQAIPDYDSNEEVFLVEIRTEAFQVRGHPWPFTPKNDAIGRFYWGRA